MNYLRVFSSVTALLFVFALTAEEGKSSLISRIKKNEEKESHVTERDNNSFLIVKSPDGRGSAFLTHLWDQPVIVSNAHVYLEMKEPEIFDINGKCYKITEVLSSKTRDLVILSYENADRNKDAKQLKVIGDAGAVPIDTKVTAYGNSLGDDVIVAQNGKLLGIGPDKIETDAPFVGGNSGGPVMLAEGREVIGVATYLRYVQPDATTKGSKYESSKVKQVVRRFATRIDNLDSEDLEVIELAKLERDRELLRQGKEWVEEIQNTFSQKVTEETFRRFRNSCLTRSRMLIEAEAYQFHSRYMKNEFESCREQIVQVLKALDMGGLTELTRIGVILETNLDNITCRKRTSAVVRCFFCRGSGKTSSKRPNPAFSSSNALVPRELIEHKPCDVCAGNGKRPLWEPFTQFAPSGELKEKIREHIAVSAQSFGGFQLGGEQEEELSRNLFYRQNPLVRFPNLFGETLLFRGNHKDRDAVCTILVFMFDRLVSVRVLYSGVSLTPREALGRCLSGDVADSSPFLVDVYRISDRKAIPTDLSGRPLLRPVIVPGSGQSTQDAQNYEGTLVVGDHYALHAVSILDRHLLEKKISAK